MDTYTNLLQSYSGRDKILRTTSYVALLLAGAADGRTAKNLGTVASQISAARTVLRLFDDLPMLKYVLRYGTGSQEKDFPTRVLSVINNLSGFIFFPIEHISWAAGNEILRIKQKPWATAAVVCWVVSLVTGILKSIRTVTSLREKRRKLLGQKKLESPERGDATFTQAMKNIAVLEETEFLLLLKNFTDLMNAVHFLPKGYLWSGRLNTSQVGLFGTIASIAGILVMLRNPK